VRSPPLTPLAAAVLHVPAPERALVIGSGDGEAALFLAREFPSARVRGVDSSAAQVRSASDRIGLDPEGRVAFKVGKPGALPYPDDFFDLVTQLDARPSPAEIARVLRPGGHLVLARASTSRILESQREKLAAARLARHGLTAVRSERAGDGRFQLLQLDPADRGVSR
jgi:ubiquinone/menaquinone biosynthesis C-methylase UbiE